MFLRPAAQEGRYRALLLAHCGKSPCGWRARGAEARVVSGEINSSQELGWRKSIAVLAQDGAASRPRMYALFPEDRCEGVLL
jgi:hypothetical protein